MADTMKRKNIKLSFVCYNILLASAKEMNSMKTSLQIWKEMKTNEVDMNLSCYELEQMDKNG